MPATSACVGAEPGHAGEHAARASAPGRRPRARRPSSPPRSAPRRPEHARGQHLLEPAPSAPPVAPVDLQEVEPRVAQRRAQRGRARRVERAGAGQRAAQASAWAQRGGLEPRERGAAHLERRLERAVHARAVPALRGAVQLIEREEREDRGRQQREREQRERPAGRGGSRRRPGRRRAHAPAPRPAELPAGGPDLAAHACGAR